MAKPYGIANQKLCYFQMPLYIDKSWDENASGEYGPRKNNAQRILGRVSTN